MKIAYLIPGTFNSGGMERVLANKCNYLVECGFDITIITTEQQQQPSFYTLSPKIKHIDIDINYCETQSYPFFLRLVWYIFKSQKHKKALRKILLQEQFDVVISMFSSETHWLPSIEDGSKKILEIHFCKFFRLQAIRKGLMGLVDRYRSYIDERAVKKYDKFAVLSNEDSAYWGALPNITTIHNATSFMPSTQSDVKHKRVIAAGRLTYQKGFDKLIKVWSEVSKKHPDWKLDIFGEGEEHDSLQSSIDKLNLRATVTINPPTKEIMQEVINSSIYLLTSNYEGFVMVLIEAMSCGVPAVSFACKCGPRDIVTDGVDGFLIEQDDISAMVDKTCALIESEELRVSMGRKAREKIEKNLSEDIIMNQWIELFKRV